MKPRTMESKPWIPYFVLLPNEERVVTFVVAFFVGLFAHWLIWG